MILGLKKIKKTIINSFIFWESKNIFFLIFGIIFYLKKKENPTAKPLINRVPPRQPAQRHGRALIIEQRRANGESAATEQLRAAPSTSVRKDTAVDALSNVADQMDHVDFRMFI